VPGSVECLAWVQVSFAICTLKSNAPSCWRLVVECVSGYRISVGIVDCDVHEGCRDSREEGREKEGSCPRKTNGMHSAAIMARKLQYDG